MMTDTNPINNSQMTGNMATAGDADSKGGIRRFGGTVAKNGIDTAAGNIPAFLD
jgi:hypothetical protein